MKRPAASTVRLLLRVVSAITVVVATAACGSADTGEDTGEGTGALGPTTTTKLRLAAFIPCAGVDAFGVFGGDNRGFGNDAAATSSRLLLDVSLNSQGTDTFAAKSFPSTKFSSSAVDRKDGWCVTLQSGARPEKTATADTGRVFATIQENSGTWNEYTLTHVRLEAHGKNPLVFFAPNADAVIDIDVYYQKVGGKSVARWITFSGNHDPFPSWELYVDGATVFQHDTRATGHGPFDLVPGGEIQESGVCEHTTTGWRCDR